MSIAGLVVNEFSSHEREEDEEEAEEEEEEEEEDRDAVLEEAAELAKKLRKLVSAAVCADRRVPVDTAMNEEKPPDVSNIKDEEERKLTLLKWKLEQKEKVLHALEAEDSDQPFEPGPMCFRCIRWMRTDKDVLKCRASCQQGAALVENMEALLWGERSPQARQLQLPLSGIWRKTVVGLTRAGWRGGPRQWRRSLLQVIPTSREVARIPRLLPKPDPDTLDVEDLRPPLGALVARGTKYRVFGVVPTVNAAPFDKEALAGTLIIEGGGTRVKGRIKGVEAFMTMTARTTEPMQAMGAPLGQKTWAALHYLEAKVVGNVFGMAIGLVAGGVRYLDTWFPDHSLRLEFDGAVRGKGMFDSVVRNADDPSQAFRDQDTIGVLVDFLACQMAWYVNGKLVAHRCRLPLAHHEARDLRCEPPSPRPPGAANVSRLLWPRCG